MIRLAPHWTKVPSPCTFIPRLPILVRLALRVVAERKEGLGERRCAGIRVGAMSPPGWVDQGGSFGGGKVRVDGLLSIRRRCETPARGANCSRAPFWRGIGRRGVVERILWRHTACKLVTTCDDCIWSDLRPTRVHHGGTVILIVRCFQPDAAVTVC